MSLLAGARFSGLKGVVVELGLCLHCDINVFDELQHLQPLMYCHFQFDL